MAEESKVRSVAIIGAGSSGAITAAALDAEGYFERIRVFERRETAGGTWIYDPAPFNLTLHPGQIPPQTDPPLHIPDGLPKITSPSTQERFAKTPIYANLTTNVPSIAMAFSDIEFAYGPFVPHNIPRQYIEGYFSAHKLDNSSNLVLNTTVEDVSLIPSSKEGDERWKLTLRKYDAVQQHDEWWEEIFDAVVLANGHYAVPFVPKVKGLDEYLEKFPGKVVHSKTYRSPVIYNNKKVLVIGNSASGRDLTEDLKTTAHLPIYQSRRSRSRWDGDTPPPEIEWKPIITEFHSNGTIEFEDGTSLLRDEVDVVIYATGYLPSYPFWNSKNNEGILYDYKKKRLEGSYLHTFFPKYPTLAQVGLQRSLSFRSFEYQAIAIARVWAGRSLKGLPSKEAQIEWQEKRDAEKRERFHDVPWENGEVKEWLGELYAIAGLGDLLGKGRNPPRLTPELIWAIENRKKYPEPGNEESDKVEAGKETSNGEESEKEWVIVRRSDAKKDLLHFI